MRYKNPLFILLLVGTVILSGMVYFGITQYQNYLQKNTETARQLKELMTAQQEKEQQLEEESKQQSLNIAALTKELEALKRKKPKVVTKTVVKEVPTQTISTELEIEKCKTKLTEGIGPPELDEIVNVVNQIFQTDLKKLNEKWTEAFGLLIQCLDSEAGASNLGRETCQIPVNQINSQIESLEKQQTNTLEDLIKQQQQTNYQDCLNLI